MNFLPLFPGIKFQCNGIFQIMNPVGNIIGEIQDRGVQGLMKSLSMYGPLKDRCVCRSVEGRFASRVPEANPGCPVLRPCNILEEPNPFSSMNFSLEGLNVVEK